MKKQKRGVALITVLSILIILLILSLGIVTLSTNNLQTVGSVSARFQTLNYAESAVSMAMYNMNTGNMMTSATPYAPGVTPTPVSCSVTVTDLTNDFAVKPDSCKAYICSDNLLNPNSNTVTMGPYGSQTIPPESAVVIGEASYRGYKRAIKAVIGNCPGVGAGLVTDKDGNLSNIEISSTSTLINGIRNIKSGEPVAGAIHANHDIKFTGSEYKCFNGSTFSAVNSIIDFGHVINAQDKNCPADKIQLIDWNVSDLINVTSTPDASTISDPAAGSTVAFGINAVKEDDPDLIINTPADDIVRPDTSLPAMSISGHERYYAGNKTATSANWPTLTVSTNTKVNGSLVVYGNLELQGGSTLFVNGTLEVKGNIVSSISGTNSGGTIITAGYRPNTTSTTDKRGVSVEVDGIVSGGADVDVNKGAALFSTGNVVLKSVSMTAPTPADLWLKNQPKNVEATIKAFKLTGLSNKSWSDMDGSLWATVRPVLTDAGKVGQEVKSWFDDANADICMLNTGPVFNGQPDRWDSFKRNPSILAGEKQNFFQGVVYTYGDVTVDGYLSVVGVVATVNRIGYTPVNATGSIYLNNGGSIVADQEYMVGSRPIFYILTEIRSWQEL